MYGNQTQIDPPEERDRRSLESGISCDLDADPTRQEFAQEADINHLVQRYGGVPDTGRPVRFGEYDFDMDLTASFEALAVARDQYQSLPENLRRAYPSVESLVEALDRGEITLGIQEDQKTPPDGQSGQNSPGGGSAPPSQNPGSPAGAPPANPPA